MDKNHTTDVEFFQNMKSKIHHISSMEFRRILKKRWISAEINGILICNLYLPNGNPLGTEKFEYKIHWMKLLYNYLKELQSIGKPIVIMGDFNIIPQDIDCKSPKKWINDALYDMDARSIFFKY